MKNSKLKFIRAVRLLAPHDQRILQLAKHVPVEKLPGYPGGAALEWVVALNRLRSRFPCPRRHCPPAWLHRP